jgi:hypothetical protein
MHALHYQKDTNYDWHCKSIEMIRNGQFIESTVYILYLMEW